jgi:hypothetical protein
MPPDKVAVLAIGGMQHLYSRSKSTEKHTRLLRTEALIVCPFAVIQIDNEAALQCQDHIPGNRICFILRRRALIKLGFHLASSKDNKNRLEATKRTFVDEYGNNLFGPNSTVVLPPLLNQDLHFTQS